MPLVGALNVIEYEQDSSGLNEVLQLSDGVKYELVVLISICTDCVESLTTENCSVLDIPGRVTPKRYSYLSIGVSGSRFTWLLVAADPFPGADLFAEGDAEAGCVVRTVLAVAEVLVPFVEEGDPGGPPHAEPTETKTGTASRTAILGVIFMRPYPPDTNSSLISGVSCRTMVMPCSGDQFLLTRKYLFALYISRRRPEY